MKAFIDDVCGDLAFLIGYPWFDGCNPEKDAKLYEILRQYVSKEFVQNLIQF